MKPTLPWALVALLLAVGLAAVAGCTAPDESVGTVASNPDRQTRYCPECRAEVGAKHHTHGSSRWCPSCKVEAADEGHRHGVSGWCPTCKVEFERTQKRHDLDRDSGHATTRLCPVCGYDVGYDPATGELVPAHLHMRTVWCDTCNQEVKATVEPGPGGKDAILVARVSDEHVHGETEYCPDCRAEVALGQPGHVHGLTRYCGECRVEAAVGMGHRHDADPKGPTRFFPQFMAELPVDPGEVQTERAKINALRQEIQRADDEETRAIWSDFRLQYPKGRNVHRINAEELMRRLDAWKAWFENPAAKAEERPALDVDSLIDRSQGESEDDRAQAALDEHRRALGGN
ncbi:MAG: hypothetical protein HY722_11460 [Planctomycetes bacterium]|nr:hypothetical protein [Planctomycetota bacterium]